MSASVADVLALDALLDKMSDLDRISIERAIQHRVEEASEDGFFADEAAAEYRTVTKDHDAIGKLLENLRLVAPADTHDAIDEIISLVAALPSRLEALGYAA